MNQLEQLIASHQPDALMGAILSRRGNLYTPGQYEIRNRYTREYAWAIPDYESIVQIAAFTDRILEIGAGTGLWAKLIHAAGVSRIIATDEAESTLHIVRHGSFYPIHRMNHKRATRIYRNEYTLMLCWPTYDTPMASESLERHVGDRLVYIGESHGGCTGNERFHEMLDDGWHLNETIYIPNWPGIHDACYLYTRKENK